MQCEVRFDLLHQVWEMLLEISRDSAARRAFDLSKYLLVRAESGNGLDPVAPEELEQQLHEQHCGTVGCAMGFAKVCVPELRVALPVRWCEYAVADALGVTVHDVVNVFMPSSYPDVHPTPEDVMSRVKGLIERYAEA